MICGAPKLSRQPVAVDCTWKLCLLELCLKLLLTENGPQPMLALPALDCALKCFSMCCVLPWNYEGMFKVLVALTLRELAYGAAPVFHTSMTESAATINDVG